jgi:glycogen synthase
MSREIWGWPCTRSSLVLAKYVMLLLLAFFLSSQMQQMLSATSFQIALLSGQNWETNLQLYAVGAVFLIASTVWYTIFRTKPSVYVLAAPWIVFGIVFFMIGLPSLVQAFVPGHRAIANTATWSYAVRSAAAFLFFGINFQNSNQGLSGPRF